MLNTHSPLKIYGVIGTAAISGAFIAANIDNTDWKILGLYSSFSCMIASQYLNSGKSFINWFLTGH